jgi:hypothetical protein
MALIVSCVAIVSIGTNSDTAVTTHCFKIVIAFLRFTRNTVRSIEFATGTSHSASLAFIGECITEVVTKSTICRAYVSDGVLIINCCYYATIRNILAAEALVESRPDASFTTMSTLGAHIIIRRYNRIIVIVFRALRGT